MLPLVLLGLGILALTMSDSQPAQGGGGGGGGIPPTGIQSCPDLDKLDPSVRGALEALVAQGNATAIQQTAIVARAQGLNALADCLESYARALPGGGAGGGGVPPSVPPGWPGIPGVPEWPWFPGETEEPPGAVDPREEELFAMCQGMETLPAPIRDQIIAAAEYDDDGAGLRTIAANVSMIAPDVSQCLYALADAKAAQGPVPGEEA